MKKIKILYEDENLLVVDKPAGVVSSRADTVRVETIQDWIERQEWWVSGQQEDEFGARSGLAHRLDKETSGCLLIAKNSQILDKLMSQFKKREVEKEYLALVHGKVVPREGTIRLPIERNKKNREQRVVGFEGKQAETSWRVERYWDKSDLSLVRLFPKTGRTHQIRVHMLHLGHPLFADSMYLSKSRRLEQDREILNRHFLHAAALSFVHPVTGKAMRVESELPKELEVVLGKLE